MSENGNIVWINVLGTSTHSRRLDHFVGSLWCAMNNSKVSCCMYVVQSYTYIVNADGLFSQCPLERRRNKKMASVYSCWWTAFLISSRAGLTIDTSNDIGYTRAHIVCERLIKINGVATLEKRKKSIRHFSLEPYTHNDGVISCVLF